ncbi:MAG TPA: hypothetical protein VGR03_07450 [Candidatus Acidoferrum sp.]|nr:hypothetical protein [Candidatus Acidoferrum sp.]
MRTVLFFLWIAGAVQLVICAANFLLPRKLNYRENLSRVSPIVRQVFLVHSAYIVGVVALFAALTFSFAAELASGHGLGRFLAAAIALFWLCRVPVQMFYYDAELRRSNRAGDIVYSAAAVFLAATYGWAAFA